MLQLHGVQQKPPEQPLNLEALDKLVHEVTDHSTLHGARDLLAGSQDALKEASMKVLRDIAADRIKRFGCQEPELVKEAADGAFHRDNS